MNNKKKHPNYWNEYIKSPLLPDDWVMDTFNVSKEEADNILEPWYTHSDHTDRRFNKAISSYVKRKKFKETFNTLLAEE